MYKIKDDIFHTTDNNGTLLLVSALDSEDCFYKATGLTKKILLDLKQKRPLEESIAEIERDFDVAPEQLRQDVDKLLSYLLENKIIEGK